MKYKTKIAALANWARAKILSGPQSEKFEIRVDDKDDDYLRVKLYMRNDRGALEEAGCMVDVSARPAKGVVLLRVNLSCTFCHEYSDEALVRLAGFLAIESIGRAFYSRTKGTEYTF
jgi:hypothetical protein